MKNQLKKWAGCLCAPVGVGLAGMLLWPAGHVLLWVVGLAVVLAGSLTFFRQRDRRFQVCFGILGTLFVLATALGRCLAAYGQTGWRNLALCLGTALCLGPAAGQCFGWLAAGLGRLKKRMTLPASKAFWLSLAVLLLGWLPVYLGLFPGLAGYDMNVQMHQILTGEYDILHPLAHTLLMQGCMSLFGVQAGFAVYILIQTLVLAAAMAYAMGWLASLRCPQWLWVAVLLLFALPPHQALLAVSATKDILFSACLLTLCVESFRWYLEPERQKKGQIWLRCAGLVTLVGLFRSNALYALAAAGVLLAIFAWRKIGRRFLLVLAAGIVLCVGCKQGLAAVTHAKTTSSTRESLSIPCQQMARAYPLMDEGTAYEVKQVFPLVELYVPWLSDPVKSVLNFGRPDRLVTFFKLWGREGLHYPIEYIDAFLLTNKGYWDVTDTSFASIYDYQQADASGVLPVRHIQGLGIEEHSLLPGVKRLLQTLFEQNEWLKIPLLRLTLHPAVYTWMALFCLTWAVWKRRFALLAGAVLPLTYLATLLLGPCCLVRYQFDLMLIAPVLTCALSAQTKEARGEEQIL